MNDVWVVAKKEKTKSLRVCPESPIFVQMASIGTNLAEILSQKTGELRSQWRLQIRLNSFPWEFSDRHLDTGQRPYVLEIRLGAKRGAL